MNLDHKLRIAISHYKGKDREAAKEAFLLVPSASVSRYRRKRGNSKPQPRPLQVCVRVTPEEYIRLRDTAKESGQSISAMIRLTLGL